MLASFTWKLIASPRAAWSRLAAVGGETGLPVPALHAAAVGGISAAGVLVGALLGERMTTGSVIVATLLAVAGYVGSAAVSVAVVPRLISAPAETRPLLPRFASAASLPVIASGVAYAIPLAAVSVMAALLGAALTFRSGSLGARDFLGMEGADRKRAATMTTVVSTFPALCAAALLAAR